MEKQPTEGKSTETYQKGTEEEKAVPFPSSQSGAPKGGVLFSHFIIFFNSLASTSVLPPSTLHMDIIRIITAILTCPRSLIFLHTANEFLVQTVQLSIFV